MDRAALISFVLVIVPALISVVIGVWVLAVSNRDRDRREARAFRVAEVEETRRTLDVLSDAMVALMSRDAQAAERLMEKAEGGVHWDVLGKDLALRWWAIQTEVRDVALGSEPLDVAFTRRFHGVVSESFSRLQQAREEARRGALDTGRFWDDPEVIAAADKSLLEGFELMASTRDASIRGRRGG